MAHPVAVRVVPCLRHRCRRPLHDAALDRLSLPEVVRRLDQVPRCRMALDTRPPRSIRHRPFVDPKGDDAGLHMKPHEFIEHTRSTGWRPVSMRASLLAKSPHSGAARATTGSSQGTSRQGDLSPGPPTALPTGRPRPPRWRAFAAGWGCKSGANRAHLGRRRCCAAHSASAVLADRSTSADAAGGSEGDCPRHAAV